MIFVCTDSTEIFSKLRSAGLTYNLLFFSLTLTVQGISNKHCLLTFFILIVYIIMSLPLKGKRVKTFSIYSEFRILKLTFHRKSASKS